MKPKLKNGKMKLDGKLNKFKNDESFKHQWADFEQFLSAESKTEENRQKDKELFNDLFKG